jgi:hypothetical protein
MVTMESEVVDRRLQRWVTLFSCSVADCILIQLLNPKTVVLRDAKAFSESVLYQFV